ncbi:MAG: B12-binding domain-containing radical SAM protein [Proteobacteria bacterium]|nr:radical SAM protein [Desulfobacteraceae bacterium]MBU4420993.1 B12-binding domain-containing radical SAM protein [Pseudomonadota bacterium]
MASVFLANAPYFLEERYGKLAAVGSTLPHMGLLMLGAVLRKSGHRVRMVDASALGLTYEETIEEIKKNQPDIIGLTAVTPSIDRTVKLAYMIKRIYPFVPIVIGGPHFTAVPQKTMKDYPVFDYGVIGEGEHTIVDLVETLASGRTPSTVPGVAIRENGKIFFSPPRAPVKDIDALPFPAWDLLDGFPHNYHPALFKYKRLPSTHIISSRGCPSKCIFCDTSVFSRRIRFHSPEYILELVDYLVKKFNIKEIIFEDDQFLLKKKRVEKICEGILRSKWNITWSCSGRVNSVNDLKFLKLMKHSGCWQINYGIESGNQRILDFAKKEITIDQIEKAVRLTHKAGILSKGYFIFGLPYETEDTMQNTIEFAKSIPLDDISIFMLTPFPGSEMYDIAEQHGRIDKDFEKMNLLDVVYVPNGLSKEILLNYQRSFMKEFYLRPRIIGNYLKRLASNPLNLYAMGKGFFAFLRHIFKLNN